LLSASHIIPAIEKESTDDPRNGIILCHNHHHAFDDFLFSIEPATKKIAYRSNGPAKIELKIETDYLHPMRDAPHVDALNWRHKKIPSRNRECLSYSWDQVHAVGASARVEHTSGTSQWSAYAYRHDQQTLSPHRLLCCLQDNLKRIVYGREFRLDRLSG
jgi:hypothetical protein